MSLPRNSAFKQIELGGESSQTHLPFGGDGQDHPAPMHREASVKTSDLEEWYHTLDQLALDEPWEGAESARQTVEDLRDAIYRYCR